jgi:hypothetical protein
MRYLLRPVVILALLGCLPACYVSFQPTQLSPEEVVAQESEVKVKVKDGDRIKTVHLRDPWVTSDSIFGRVPGTRGGGGGGTWHAWGTWAAPLSAVVSLETKQDRTDALVLGGLLADGMVAVTLTALP